MIRRLMILSRSRVGGQNVKGEISVSIFVALLARDCERVVLMSPVLVGKHVFWWVSVMLNVIINFHHPPEL